MIVEFDMKAIVIAEIYQFSLRAIFLNRTLCFSKVVFFVPENNFFWVFAGLVSVEVDSFILDIGAKLTVMQYDSPIFFKFKTLFEVRAPAEAKDSLVK